LLPGDPAGPFFLTGKKAPGIAFHLARDLLIGMKSPLKSAGVLFLVIALFILHLFVRGQAGAQAPPAAPFSFRLVGTFSSKTLSGAVLVDATGQQAFYRLREKLPDESQIIKVQNDSILLKRPDGMTYELFIAQDRKEAAPPPPAPAASSVSPPAEQRQEIQRTHPVDPRTRHRSRPPRSAQEE
jgi:hypothetical protein